MSATQPFDVTQGHEPVEWQALTLRPAFIFLNMYLLRRGFLDGRKGLFLAASYAYYTFLKYYRFSEKDLDTTDPERNEERNPLEDFDPQRQTSWGTPWES